MAAVSSLNFLDFVPECSVECAPDAQGSIMLLVPKFGNGRIGAWWSRVVGHRSVLKIHLDELGLITWEAIDGRRNVGQIAELVSESSGEDLPSMYDRCSRFIRQLAEAGAVKLSPPGPG